MLLPGGQYIVKVFFCQPFVKNFAKNSDPILSLRNRCLTTKFTKGTVKIRSLRVRRIPEVRDHKLDVQRTEDGK